MTLKILPNGRIKGGSFFYAYSVDGTISYSVSVLIGFLWMTRPYSFSGKSSVDPKVLVSADLKPNDEFNFGNLGITVKKIYSLAADCDVTLPQGSGVAMLSLKNPTIELQSLSLKVRVPILGMQTIEATV